MACKNLKLIARTKRDDIDGENICFSCKDYVACKFYNLGEEIKFYKQRRDFNVSS